jgi:hypothetical protein
MASFTTAPANWTNVTNDANFRAWGSYISARLTAVGIVKTADTGQIDWTTVANPGAINTFAGYEIRVFADALQASAPVYIKIEYGESATTDAPAVRFAFGSGSNGTGTLTGTLSGTYWATGGASVTTACSVHGSGDTARFCMNGGYQAAQVGMIFGFERTKDAAGADTTEGVLYVATGTAGSVANQRIIGIWNTSLGDVGGTTAILIPALFPPGATATSGTQIIVVPIFHSKGVFMNPGMNFAGYYTESIAAAGSPSVYAYGALHTYYTIAAASGWASSNFQGPGAGTEAMMLRYE